MTELGSRLGEVKHACGIGNIPRLSGYYTLNNDPCCAAISFVTIPSLAILWPR